MKVTITAADPARYVEHVSAAISEALPAMMRWQSGDKDSVSRMMLDTSLAHLEHACRIARAKL